MKKKVIEFCSILFLIFCFHLKSVTAEVIISGGEKRSYLLYVPVGVTTNAPLLVVLHGGGGETAKAAGFMREVTGFDLLADREKFVVVYPTGGAKAKNGKAHWNDGRFGSGGKDDFQFLSDLIGHIVQKYNLDPKRVYLTGISNGAMMSYAYVCASGSRKLSEVAGIAPVAGAMNTISAKNCNIAKPVSIISIHGTNDRFILPIGGKVWLSEGEVISQQESIGFFQRKNKCNSQIQSTTLPDNVRTDYSSAVLYAQNCEATNTKITVISVNGGGHTWPGHSQCPGCGPLAKRLFNRLVGTTCMDFDASRVVWDFFAYK